MNKKKLVREAFRTEVFTRDKHKCKICGVKSDKLDAHHITDRNKMPNGGYVKENGISLCPMHHLAAEYSIKSNHGIVWKGVRAEDLYRLIGSSLDKATKASEKL